MVKPIFSLFTLCCYLFLATYMDRVPPQLTYETRDTPGQLGNKEPSLLISTTKNLKSLKSVFVPILIVTEMESSSNTCRQCCVTYLKCIN